MAIETGETKAQQNLTCRLTEVARGYRRMLALDPHHSQALVGMSLVALPSRQTEAAVKMASTAAKGSPGMGTAWVALGQALKAAGEFESAEQAYARAIRLDGMNELARLGLGELEIGTGRPAESIFEFVLARLGRVEEAETRYRRALVLRPDFAAAWMNLGSLLCEQGREVYAQAALLRSVELRPDLVAGWINLAVLERERHRPVEAEAHLRKAFALNPEQVETQIAWCQFRASKHDLAGEWGWLRWAQARDPEQLEAVNMGGILLHAEHRFAEAIAAFEREETLGHSAAASNGGNTLLEMGRMQEALQAHQTAVERDSIHAGARYNLALTQLRLCDWEHGWTWYEARWHFREVHRMPRVFSQPRWQGEVLEGQRILLHAEQGLGDTLQFCRYATLVAARGGYAILQVQPAAERLLYSLCVVCSGQAETALLNEKMPAYDLECPLMSLPAVFETTPDTVPWPGAYLGADPRLAHEKRAAFPDDYSGLRSSRRPLRVGLAWAGNPLYKADLQRSMSFEAFLPLLRTQDITWISLQKGPAAAQLSAAQDGPLVWDGCSRDHDLAETAALIATLDLVITTDTCIAHLAGAMARPVWILLPRLRDWRWMEQLETTPCTSPHACYASTCPAIGRGCWIG